MRSREDLIAALREGLQPKYLFFWGHQPRKDGSLGKSILSQWWPCRFEVEGETFKSAEHYMMAGKARLFGDEEARAQILAARTPGEDKKIGRRVQGFVDEVWREKRFDLVVDGNAAKFGQDEAMKVWLLNTGERVLVEASPRDRLWGNGLHANHADAADPKKWPGLNLLGFALMEARARLA